MPSAFVASAPAAPVPALLWSGQTDTGRVRPNNEDAFLALAVDGFEARRLGKSGAMSLAGADFVFAVSDGMGGAKSGEFASQSAVDRITRLFPRSFRLAAAGLARGEADILAELFSSIHHDLLRLGFAYEECAGMGATLSLAWFTPSRLFFAHVGDSRIYRLSPDGAFTQLTEDHTHVGWLRRQGRLNEREARAHPMRHALNQSLGAGHQHLEPHFGAVDFAIGDRFLLCSDGLTDGLWDRQLAEALAEPPPASLPVAQRLVADSVANSGRDNTTAVVVEVRPAVSFSV